RIGARGTGFRFGNAWRRVCAMATSPFTRLAFGAGGSILKPPTPGAIGGPVGGAIAGHGGGASNFRSSMPSASISSFGPEVRFLVVLQGRPRGDASTAFSDCSDASRGFACASFLASASEVFEADRPICAARCLESGVEALIPAIDACHSPIEGGDGIGA